MEHLIKQLQPKEGVTLLAWLAPEGAYDFKLLDGYLSYIIKKYFAILNEVVKLPFECKLLGIATEIPEEVWQTLMCDDNEGADPDNPFQTAKESGLSFLHTNEVYSEKPDDCQNQWCDGGKIDMGYNEYLFCELCEKAESNTGTWVILQLINQ